MRSSELSPLVIVLWLGATALVGVAGCIMLERGHVGQPLPLGRAVVLVLAVEILLYLAALLVGGRGLIPAGRVVMGIVLGMVIRASLSLIAVQLAMPVRAGAPTLTAGLGFYYAQYWPGALVQILAVSVFLWFVRDVWETSEMRWTVGERAEEFVPPLGAAEDGQTRREELLAALMEGPEDEEAEPTEPALEREQLELALAREETLAEQVEPADMGETEEDTSQIPVVVEEEPGAAPAEPTGQSTRAEELLANAAGAGAVADTVVLTGGG